MTETLLDLLTLVLLALLYRFFARVVWSVWSEVRAPATGTTPRTSTGDRPTRARRSRRPMTHTPYVPARLVDIITGADWTLPVDGTSIVLGRDPACEVHLDDPSVSSRHCRITMHDGQPLVDDLSSTNGTIINTARITGTHLLAAGDLITLGTISVEARP